MGVSQNQGYLFGGPYNKDYSILGSILGSPYFGKLPDQSVRTHKSGSFPDIRAQGLGLRFRFRV